MSDSFLHKYYLNNPGKLLHKWFHYFDIYERHFTRFRNKAPVMLEIGVFGGGSLAMWKGFFGKGCKLIGVDINPDCKVHEAEDIEIFIGSQDDPELFEQILENYPNIDIILDDGSHVMYHMISTFEMLYEKLHPYGVYMVEDTHTCYWPKFDGGLRREGSFIEFTKNKIDEIHAAHTKGAVPTSAFTMSTDVIACYDSVVVFERRPQGHRQSVMTKAMNEP